MARDSALDARLAARRDSLSPTEQRVADFFARHWEEIAFLSATEIAQQIGTSDATVVRAAQSLGYRGLQELKREIASALRSHATPTSRPEHPLEEIGEDPESVLDHALTLQIALLEEMRQTIPPAGFARALDLIHAADRAVVYGTGPSAALADHLAMRLIRIGRLAVAMTSTGVALADDLLAMRPGDLLVLIAYEHVSREIAVMLDHTKTIGIPAILLTDTLDAALTERIAVSLSVCRGETDSFRNVATILVLIDALVIGLTARDPSRALATAKTLQNLREQMRGE